MTILVTGGAGYIGSHTCVELLQSGHDVIVVDDFSNSKIFAVKQIEIITGKSVILYKLDLLNQKKLDAVFAKHKIDAVIHFAGLKSPSESVTDPLRYYHTNIMATINLIQAMQSHGVKKIVF